MHFLLVGYALAMYFAARNMFINLPYLYLCLTSRHKCAMHAVKSLRQVTFTGIQAKVR